MTMEEHYASLMARDAKTTRYAMRRTGRAEPCRAPRRSKFVAPHLIEAERLMRAGMSPEAVQAKLGLKRQQVSRVVGVVHGPRPKGCKPGQGGAKRMARSIEAERLLRQGMTNAAVVEATGLSRSQTDKLAKAIREGEGA